MAPALLGAGRLDEARASRDALLAAYPDMTVRMFKDAMVFSAPVLDRFSDQLLEVGVPNDLDPGDA